jgi:hypothetical protein
MMRIASFELRYQKREQRGRGRPACESTMILTLMLAEPDL